MSRGITIRSSATAAHLEREASRDRRTPLRGHQRERDVLVLRRAGALGALLTVSPGVRYSDYQRQADVWHIDALADQQLAGLIMGIPAGVIFIVLGLALFAAWLGESERRVALGLAAGVHSEE